MDADELIAKAIQANDGRGYLKDVAKEAARLAYLDAAEIAHRENNASQILSAKASEMGK